MSIKNPRNYEEKVPTNIRLDKDIKEYVLEEAERLETTQADIVNRIIRDKMEGSKRG